MLEAQFGGKCLFLFTVQKYHPPFYPIGKNCRFTPQCAQSAAALCRPAPRSRTTWRQDAPKARVPRTGHHHFLFGLAVAGHAQHFVFVALEMPVAARLHIVFECFHVILFYTDTRHSGAECHIYNQYSIFQHGKKGFGRKDGEKGGRRRQKPGDRVGCLNCRATDAILKR